MVARLMTIIQRLITPQRRWRRSMEEQRSASAERKSQHIEERRTEAPKAGSYVVQRILGQQEGRKP